MMVVMTFWALAGIALLAGLVFLHKRKYLVVVLVSLVGVLLVYETAMTWWLPNAERLGGAPHPLLAYGRRVYENVDMNIIQLQPEYSRYDPELTYTLKPGTFAFTSHEFDTRFDVNALGFRDDMESARDPEIVVLGDSYAMGWGVDQDETFAQVMERETGYKVLNLGISSYGTVREMRSLDRIDRSHLKYLVVQYCDNDVIENRSFLEHGTLAIKDRASYEREAHEYAQAFEERKFFGKYTLFHVTEAVRRINATVGGLRLGPAPADREPPDEVEAFLNALTHASRADLTGVQLIVLFLSDHQGREQSAKFLSKVNRMKQRATYPAHIRNLVTVELQEPLTAEHYFVLDGHIDGDGHSLIAHEIMRLLPPKTMP